MALQYILWDWNGTLLDDVHIALEANNLVFPTFGLPPLGTIHDYLEVFDFPIRDYYQKVGVPDDLFDDVAKAWSHTYMEISKKAPLQKEAPETLAYFASLGLKQVILSASKADHLHEQVARYPIGHYFDEMLGLNNIYAASKVDLAKDYFARENISPDHALFIGDTLHDAQVAKAIGCQCVLVAKGHQPAHRLEKAHVPIYNHLLEIPKDLPLYNHP